MDRPCGSIQVWNAAAYIFFKPSVKTQADHCIEILRQYLMCTADVTPITSKFVPFKSVPDVDFSTMHVCRDFEGILQWVQENTVKEITEKE